MPVNARLVIRDADADGAGFWIRSMASQLSRQATARAATDDALTVHGSVVSVPDRAFQPGWWFDGTDAFAADRPFNELQQRQAAFTHLHGYLNTLAVDLAAEGGAHPVAEVHAAHNFPALAHHAAYRVGHHADPDPRSEGGMGGGNAAWAEQCLLPFSSGINGFRCLHRWWGQRLRRLGLTLQGLYE